MPPRRRRGGRGGGAASGGPILSGKQKRARMREKRAEATDLKRNDLWYAEKMQAAAEAQQRASGSSSSDGDDDDDDVGEEEELSSGGEADADSHIASAEPSLHTFSRLKLSEDEATRRRQLRTQTVLQSITTRRADAMVGGGKRSKHDKKTVFLRESDLVIAERKRAARLPLRRCLRAVERWEKAQAVPALAAATPDAASGDDIEATDLAPCVAFTELDDQVGPNANYYEEVIDMPVRPPWQYDTPKAEFLAREEQTFREWLESIYSRFAVNRLNHFEHNLEVWRQLWRVLERSDICLLLADARHPLFHFPPALYRFVTGVLGKPMLLVLTKIDLITAPRLDAWMAYFRAHYPRMHCASYSAFPIKPDAPTADSLDPMVKRRRRMNTGRLVDRPWGADELLEQCAAIVAEARQRQAEAADTSGGVALDGVDVEAVVGSGPLSFRAVSKQRRRALADARRALRALQTSADESASPLLAETLSDAEEDDSPSASEGDEGDDESGDSSAEDDFDRSNYYYEHGGKTRRRRKLPFITLGLLGHPNVGKSSLINSLLGYKQVSVSITPGHTKHLQTIFLNDRVCLCDCPGLVFPAVDMPRPLQVLSGLVPIAQCREPYSSVGFLAEHVPIERIYGLDPRSTSAWEEQGGTAADVAAAAAMAADDSSSDDGGARRKKKKQGRRRKKKNQAPSSSDDSADAGSDEERSRRREKKATRRKAVQVAASVAAAAADQLARGECVTLPDGRPFQWSGWSLCEAWASKRGYHNKSGTHDTYRAGNELLRDALYGRVVLSFAPPPTRH